MGFNESKVKEESKDYQLKLFNTYFLVLKYIQGLPVFIWLPISFVLFGKSIRLPILKLPILRSIVLIFTSSHLKCTLNSVKQEYLLRTAITGEKNERDEVKNLSEQVKSMEEGLPIFKLPTWAIAASVFIFVLLSRQILPQEYSSLIPKAIAAFVTSDPEKLSSLAAEPKILDAIIRLVFLILMLLILFIPIVIIHFRFKRLLFNDAGQLDKIKKATTKDVWEQKLSYAGSLYDIEKCLLRSLGSFKVSEYPLDLALIITAYAYHAFGPGLLLCIIAAPVNNTFMGKTLFAAGIINIIIGLSNIGFAVCNINQRSIFQARNQSTSSVA